MKDEATISESSLGENASQQSYRRWLIRLYSGVRKFYLSEQDLTMRSQFLGGIADTTCTEWSNNRAFLLLIWSPQFFIVRHEADAWGRRTAFSAKH